MGESSDSKSLVWYKRLRKIPVFGGIFLIANAYAFEGDIKHNKEIAPFKQWAVRIIVKVLTHAILALSIFLLSSYVDNPISCWDWNPAETVMSGFPSILGFGIGVYALLFIMPNQFIEYLIKKKVEGSKISPELIQADMGYPLVVFVGVMFIAVIGLSFPSSDTLKIVSLWALLYGLAMALELVTFLFNCSGLMRQVSAK